MSKIESLELEVKLLEQRRAKLVQKRNSELNQYFKNFFHDLPFEKIGGYDCSTFYFAEQYEEDSKFNREICTLYLRRRNYNQENFDQVNISYYSTQSHSKFELNRLITIGKLAEVVKEYSKNILNDHREIVSKYSRVISRLDSKIFYAKGKVTDAHNEIIRKEKEKNSKRAFTLKGVVFNEAQTFELKNGYQAYGVKRLRILGWVNENKKSVNVEISCEVKRWDEEKLEYVVDGYHKQTHDKIRYSNIKNLIENKEL